MIKVFAKNFVRMLLNRLGYELVFTGKSTFDPFVIQKKTLLKANPLIFDVGAHHGGITQIYRKHFPSATIHCFEPFPESFKSLIENVGSRPETFCHLLAVSDKTGLAYLNANKSSFTNSLLATDERAKSFWGDGLLTSVSKIEVQTTCIEDFCCQNTISHIDILKMDVQGAEFSVLKGAKDFLARQKISIIYTELITCPTYKGQYKWHELMAFLDSFNYELLDFFSPQRSNHQLIQVDALFLSSTFKKEISRQLIS